MSFVDVREGQSRRELVVEATNFTSSLVPEEWCTNGNDDDGDGREDASDPECAGSVRS